MNQFRLIAASLLLSTALAGCSPSTPSSAGTLNAGDGQIGDSTSNVGQVALQNHNPTMALSIASAILGKVPNDIKALNLQSQAYYDQGNVDDAAKSARAALVVDPHDADANMELGRAIDSADPAGALAAFQQALAADPGNEAAYIDTGVAQAQLGNTDKAVATFSQAIDLYPNDPVPQLNLGVLLALRNQPGDMAKARGILSGLANGKNPSQDEISAWKYVQSQG